MTRGTGSTGRSRKVGLVLLLAVLLAGLSAIAVSDLKALLGQSPKAARMLDTPVPVRVEPARLEAVPEVVGANGLAEPSVVVNLASRVTGTVEKVHVDVGQLVHQGDRVVTMEKAVPQATLAAAQADLAKARGEVAVSKLQLERMARLFEQKVVSNVDYETAQVKLGTAVAAESAAQEALARARQDAELGIDMTSPITAVVQERFVNSGESIREVRQPLLRLGRVDAVLVAARVAEEKTPNLALGQTAEVLFDAFPTQPFPGTVEKIDGAVNPETRTFRAYVRVDNKDLRLKPGLSAYVRIHTTRQALTVPRLAVIERAAQASVFVVEGDRARLKAVRVLPIGLGRVAVLQGLSAGDPVVYFKVYNLEDNDRVVVEERPAKTPIARSLAPAAAATPAPVETPAAAGSATRTSLPAEVLPAGAALPRGSPVSGFLGPPAVRATPSPRAY